MKRSSNQKRIPFIVTGRLSAFCFTTTKLTGNEFYCYKIEALQFFPFTSFDFEPSSRHLHLIYR